MGRQRRDEMRGEAKGGGSFLNIKHPGALRKTLGVSGDKKIPAAKLESATHSDNPTTKRRAILAETMKKWHH